MAYQEGGRILGEGSYGCTFYPAPRCANGSVFQTKNTDNSSSIQIVGKIVQDEPIVSDEVAIGKTIMGLRNASDYFALPTVMCEPEMPVRDPDVGRCDTISKAEKGTKFQMFGMPNAGVPLDVYRLTNRAEFATNFKQIFIHLLEGAVIYQDAGFVHNDIHTENILVDSSGKARYIDFGLAFRPAIVKRWRDAGQGTSFKPARNYVWMPPEVIVWRMRHAKVSLRSGMNTLYQMIPDYRILEQQFPAKKTMESAMEDFLITDNFARNVNSIGFLKEYGKRFDSWRIGYSMWVCWNDLLRWPGFVNYAVYKDRDTRELIRKVLGGLTEFDPRRRFTVGEALRILL